MSDARARALVRQLRLRPHPEGGFYRETYRAPLLIPRRALPRRYGGARAAATSILFLLPRGAVSRLHRIASDEAWHFHLGGPLLIVEIGPGGRPRRTLLGPDPARGHRLQHVVPAGTWFGARPAPGTAFTLVGCAVAPGFDFADFEMGDRAELLRRFSAARGEVLRLTA
jgi:predicted cupin superfamily sugar epimerase